MSAETVEQVPEPLESVVDRFASESKRILEQVRAEVNKTLRLIFDGYQAGEIELSAEQLIGIKGVLGIEADESGTEGGAPGE